MAGQSAADLLHGCEVALLRVTRQKHVWECVGKGGGILEGVVLKGTGRGKPMQRSRLFLAKLQTK